MGLEQWHETCCQTPAQCKYTSNGPPQVSHPCNALMEPLARCSFRHVRLTPQGGMCSSSVCSSFLHTCQRLGFVFKMSDSFKLALLNLSTPLGDTSSGVSVRFVELWIEFSRCVKQINQKMTRITHDGEFPLCPIVHFRSSGAL